MDNLMVEILASIASNILALGIAVTLNLKNPYIRIHQENKDKSHENAS
jgi:hypothetical protein